MNLVLFKEKKYQKTRKEKIFKTHKKTENRKEWCRMQNNNDECVFEEEPLKSTMQIMFFQEI